MIEYLKFWIARELAVPAILLFIFVAAAVAVCAVAFANAVTHALRKKWRSLRGAQRP